MIKGLFFDFDGTLVDSERYYVEGTYTWLKSKGYTGEMKAIYPIIGKTMAETGAILAQLLGGKMSEEEVLAYNHYYFTVIDPLDYAKYRFPDVLANIRRFKAAGYKMAVCSTSSREEIEAGLNSLKLKKYFDHYFCAEDCIRLKPDSEIYLKALAYFKLKPTEALAIEDSTNGLLAAKGAKIYTVARIDRRFALDQSPADAFVNDLGELVGLVREINYGR